MRGCVLEGTYISDLFIGQWTTHIHLWTKIDGWILLKVEEKKQIRFSPVFWKPEDVSKQDATMLELHHLLPY